jgi:multicomponent Na+:H+ antiporter subunit F
VSGFLLGSAAFLLLTIALGLYRVVRGPRPADRMVAAQLFGTTGIAVILLLGAAYGEPAATDIAIVFALLAALAAAAFVRCGYPLVGDETDGAEPGPAEEPQ